MHPLIDIYVKRSGRWVWEESTRMHATLAAARRHYAHMYGCEVRAKFA